MNYSSILIPIQHETPFLKTLKAFSILTSILLLLVNSNNLIAQDYCLDFNGSNQYVDCGQVVVTGANPRTIEGWVYCRTFADKGIWRMGQSNPAEFTLRTHGSLDDWWVLQMWEWSYDFHIPNSKNNWVHFAMVYDGTTTKLYANGTLVVNYVKSLNTQAGDFLLGVWGPNYFDGKLDEVRVWNVARSQEQIQATMKTLLTGTENGLIAYYPMNEGAGTSIADNSANSFTGTLVGNPIWKNTTHPRIINVGSGQLYTSIASAVESASSGDVVNLVDSYYSEHNLRIEKGITLKGARATASIINANGRGRVMSIVSSDSVTLINLNIQNGRLSNRDWGAGLYVYATKIIIEDCIFQENHALGGGGGGIYASGGSNISVRDSRFIRNSVDVAGGGICMWNPADVLTITNCEFDENMAKNYNANGGGIYSSGNVTISDSEIINCLAKYNGGGLYLKGNLTMTNCTVFDNNAVMWGGGIYSSGITANITGSTINNNRSWLAGGGIDMESSNYTLTNCTITGNEAYGNAGGGIYLDNNSVLNINSCTINNNYAYYGGGIYYSYNCLGMTLRNSIIADNLASEGPEIHSAGSVISANNCLIENYTYYQNNMTGSGNIFGVDPQLQPLALNDNPNGTFTCALSSTSPAINAGTPVDATPFDQRGLPRKGVLDIGAYEYQSTLMGSPFSNNAIVFNGEKEFINCGDSFNLSDSSFTIEFWAKKKISEDGVILHCGNGSPDSSMSISFRSQGLKFSLGQNDLDCDFTTTDNNWHHMAFIYNADNKEQKIYVDGLELAKKNTDSDFNIAGTFYIGSSLADFSNYKGLIDELRVWSSVRTTLEIRENIHTQIDPFNSTDLLAFWPMDNGKGDIIKDIGGDNDGIFDSLKAPIWIMSSIPFGYGNSGSELDFQSGSTTIDSVTITMIQSFEKPVDLVVSQIRGYSYMQLPFGEGPIGYRYFIINSFGNDGKYLADLTFKFGEYEITPMQKLPLKVWFFIGKKMVVKYGVRLQEHQK